MPHAEGAITLTRAAHVALPASALPAWRDDVDAVLQDAAPHGYRELCDRLFAATPYEPRTLCATAALPPGARITRAAQATQAELALQAVQGLSPADGSPCPVAQARLLLYATSSIDVDPYASTVSGLAAQFGASGVPHLAIGQMQGAALDLCAELIDATLTEPGSGALFVAVERWPEPYPRVWDGRLLADGAAALWFVHGRQRGLQYLGSLQQGHDPFVEARWRDGRAEPRIDLAALEAAVGGAIDALLAAHGVGAADLQGWIGGALDPTLDQRLLERLGAGSLPRVRPQAEGGHLGTTTAALQLAQALQGVAGGSVADGSLLLSWNASLGGTVTAALWRACTQGDDS
jgi:hypothetical protein